MSASDSTPPASHEARGCCERGPRSRGLARSAALLAIAILALLGLSARAQAGPARFTYEVCDSALPGGNTPGAHFVVDSGVAYAGNNSCAQPGGSLSISETGPVQSSFSLWNVPIESVPGGQVEDVTVTTGACGLGGAAWGFLLTSAGEATNTCPTEVERLFHGTTVFGAALWLLCTHGSGECGAGPAVWAHYFAATEVDPNPPTVSGVSGSLLAGGPIRGHQTIAAHLADKGGGLSEAAVLVNGSLVGKPISEPCSVTQVKNSSVTGPVTGTVTPCPGAAEESWTVDTQSYPFHNGTNNVQVCGWDFATLGEANVGCSAAQSINVDNSCTPSEVDGGELLSAQFEGSNSETETVGFGAGAEVSGKLATNAGDPVPGATLCVKMDTLGTDAKPATVGSLTTDANGEYHYKLAPGPDRGVVIGYRYDSHQVAREVRYYAHARSSLKLAPPRLRNGERVRFWGRLPGPRPGRRVVVIQANAPGSKRWITFRKATSDGHGSFQSGYRFNSTTRRTRYRFRAVVPRQAGYPWVEGHSKPAPVVVEP